MIGDVISDLRRQRSTLQVGDLITDQRECWLVIEASDGFSLIKLLHSGGASEWIPRKVALTNKDILQKAGTFNES